MEILGRCLRHQRYQSLHLHNIGQLAPLPVLQEQGVTNRLLVRRHFHTCVQVLLVVVHISIIYATLCYPGLWICPLISWFMCHAPASPGQRAKPSAVCTNTPIHERYTEESVHSKCESYRHHIKLVCSFPVTEPVRHRERRKKAPSVQNDADPTRYYTHPHRHLRPADVNLVIWHVASFRIRCCPENLPVDKEHGNVHRSHSEYDVEPRVLRDSSVLRTQQNGEEKRTLYRVPVRSSSRSSPTI